MWRGDRLTSATTIARWLKRFGARSLVTAVLGVALAAFVGLRVDDGQPNAEAAGGFRMVVVGLAADSAPEQSTPEAWASFATTYDLTVAGYRYSILVQSEAPVFTTEVFPGRTGAGDGPGLSGPTELSEICSVSSQASVTKIALRTHGLLLPSSQLATEILLALQPATYRSTTTFDCPTGMGELLIDSGFWWVLFHQDDFADYAGAYVLDGFTGPDPSDPGCVVARLHSDQTRSLGAATVRERLQIVITSSPVIGPGCFDIGDLY